MKKINSNLNPISGLEMLPNQIDLTSLFEVKGGSGFNICIGNNSEAVKCQGENAGVLCEKTSAVSCTGQSLGLVICPSNAKDRDPNPTTCPVNSETTT